MGEPRLTRNAGAQEPGGRTDDRHSVPANSVVKPTSPLNRARQTEDEWDDRYGLLPPEPPESVREDSVMLALSAIASAPAVNSNAVAPLYGTLAAPLSAEYAEALLKRRLNASLSVVAGYVDAAGFLALFGLFPAHLTGELVSAAALSAVPQSSAVWIRLLMAALFIVGVVISVLFARRYIRSGQPSLTPQLALLTTCLGLFCAAGHFRPQTAGPFDWWTTATAGAAVLAMGVQNAMMRQALVGTLPTTVMTGNLTQFVTEIVDLCLGLFGRAKDPETLHASARRLRVLGRAITCFFSGAMIGAWITQTWGLSSVIVPVVIAGLMTAFAWRAQSVVRS